MIDETRAVRPPRVAIAAGGTGGHIAPALALGEALRQTRPGVEIKFLCGDKPFERRMFESEGHHPAILRSRPLAGRDPLALARSAAGIGSAVLKARRLLRKFEPSVIVGMGGYVAAPAILAARTLGVPACVHEQNAIPGRANRLLSRWAQQATAAHPEALGNLRARRRRAMGNPLHPRLFEPTSEQGLSAFGLEPGRPVALVLGGSQGAEGLNERAFEAASLLAKRFPGASAPQFLWATGERRFDFWKNRVREAGLEDVLHVRGFIDDMPRAYAAADIAVSRAGAGTIAELTALGLPSILVPYPHARDDHQTANARDLAKVGGAELRPEDTLTGESLASLLEGLLYGPSETLRRMSAAALTVARPDAAWEMARMVLDMARPLEPGRAVRESASPLGALAV